MLQRLAVVPAPSPSSSSTPLPTTPHPAIHALFETLQNSDTKALPSNIEHAIHTFIIEFEQIETVTTTTNSLVDCVCAFGRFLRSTLIKANVGVAEQSLIGMLHVITDLARDAEFEAIFCKVGVLDDFVRALPLVASQTMEPATPGARSSAYTAALLTAFLDTLSNLTTSTDHAARALRSDVLIHACNILEQYRVPKVAWEEAAGNGGSGSNDDDDDDDENSDAAEDTDVTTAVVSLLRNLSAGPHTMRPLVAASGVIAPLVALIGEVRYDAPITSDVLATLLNVSCHDASDGVLTANFTMNSLIDCIDNSNSALKMIQDVDVDINFDVDANTNANSNVNDEEDEQTITIHAAMTSIELALRTVRNMCSNEHNAVEICRQPTLRVILDAMASSKMSKGRRIIQTLHANVTQSASMVLENVSKFADEERCSVLVQTGVVENLVRVLGGSEMTPEAKAAAADGLVSMMLVDAKNGVVKGIIGRGVGGSMLVSMLELRMAERQAAEDDEESDEESEEDSEVEDSEVEDSEVGDEEEEVENEDDDGEMKMDGDISSTIAFGSSMNVKR